MNYAALYVLTVLVVNIAFTVVPPIDLGFGVFTPVALVVGVVFVVRDFAQRAVGHWVLLAMLIGTFLSFMMAEPAIAVASALSFAASEFVDWATYTATRRPFRTRVLYSTLLGAPIDTVLFLYLVDMFEPANFVLMTAGKFIAAILIRLFYREDNLGDLRV